MPISGKQETDLVTDNGLKREVLNRRRVGNLFQFADDLMVLVRGKTVDHVRRLAMEAYEKLSDWFLKSRLKLNSEKSHFMFFMTRQRAVGKNTISPLKFGNYETIMRFGGLQ